MYMHNNNSLAKVIPSFVLMPIPSFSMFCTEKLEGLVCHGTQSHKHGFFPYPLFPLDAFHNTIQSCMEKLKLIFMLCMIIVQIQGPVQM